MTTNLRRRPLHYLGYLLASATLVFSITFPYVFQYASMYAAPTAAYAVQVARMGNLSPAALGNAYWRDNISLEQNFPVPSVLLLIVLEATGIPLGYAMFIAISALGQVAFFALARCILSGRRDPNGQGVFLAALCYAYIASIHVTVSYLGRGTLGVALLMQFMLAYTLFLRTQLKKRRNARSWLAVLLVFTLAIGYTYYSSLLGIFVSTALTILAVGTLGLVLKRTTLRVPAFPVALLSFSLLIYGPFTSILSSTRGGFASFFYNLKVLARIETPPEILLQRGLVQQDSLTTITGYYALNALKVLSGLVILYGLVAYRPRRGHEPKLLWLFCLSVLFLSFAELSYLLVAAAAPIRFISMFGLIVLLFSVRQSGLTRKADSAGNRWPGRLQQPIRTYFAGVLLVILILASYGSMRTEWYYGVAKPQAYDKVEPLADFLLSHSTANTPAMLAGDADYAANLFYMACIHAANDRLVPEPLGTDTLALYTALHTGENGNLVARLHERGLFLLLTVEDARPVWGDEWGYGFLIPNSPRLNMTLIYDDGRARLYVVS
jgi:hypothetical protein